MELERTIIISQAHEPEPAYTLSAEAPLRHEQAIETPVIPERLDEADLRTMLASAAKEAFGDTKMARAVAERRGVTPTSDIGYYDEYAVLTPQSRDYFIVAAEQRAGRVVQTDIYMILTGDYGGFDAEMSEYLRHMVSDWNDENRQRKQQALEAFLPGLRSDFTSDEHLTIEDSSDTAFPIYHLHRSEEAYVPYDGLQTAHTTERLIQEMPQPTLRTAA